MQAQELSLNKAMEIVKAQMEAENFRVAEMALRDILKTVPDDFEANYWLGLALYYMGRLEESVTVLKALTDSEDASAEYFSNLAIILLADDKGEDALKWFDRAIETDPSYAQAYWNKSNVLWLLDRFEDSAAFAQKAIDLNDRIPEAWLNLGVALVKLDKKEEAITAWKRALDLNPDFSTAWNNLGNVQRELGLRDESEASCAKALELDPENVQALNNMGNVLNDKGKLEEAEGYYRRAIALKTDYAEAHNNIAVVLMHRLRYDEALIHARYATSFRKNYVDAWLNQSEALLNLGKLEEAERAVQQALNHSPETPEIQIALANILLMRDNVGDAEVEIRRARDAFPDSPQLLLKLASVLERANKFDEAIETVDQALEKEKDMTDAYLRKGQIYFVAQQLDKAEEAYLKARELSPDMPNAYVALSELYQAQNKLDLAWDNINKAREINKNLPGIFMSLSNLKKFTADDEDFQAMLELRDTIDTWGLEQSYCLHYALFSAFENIGDYDEAFKCLKKASDTKRLTLPYSHARTTTYFSNIKKIYTPDTAESFRGRGSTDETPVFIVGMPRSGTTLTEQIISSHPDVFGAGELRELGIVEAEFKGIAPDQAADAGKRYVEMIRELDPGGTARRITDKMPGNFLRVGLIRAILPNAKIIHCRRDAFDTCLSCYKQNFARGQYWSYNLEELGMYYNMYKDLMEYWRELYKGEFLEIDYEDTVNDFENQARKLIDYVGLDWNDACLEPHKQKRAILTASKMQVIKPVYKTSVAAWKRYETQLEPMIRVIEDGTL